jgi:hypothetical protein
MFSYLPKSLALVSRECAFCCTACCTSEIDAEKSSVRLTGRVGFEILYALCKKAQNMDVELEDFAAYLGMKLEVRVHVQVFHSSICSNFLSDHLNPLDRSFQILLVVDGNLKQESNSCPRQTSRPRIELYGDITHSFKMVHPSNNLCKNVAQYDLFATDSCFPSLRGEGSLLGNCLI